MFKSFNGLLELLECPKTIFGKHVFLFTALKKKSIHFLILSRLENIVDFRINC